MAVQPFTARYTTLELYLKHLPFEPYTTYTLSLDTLGGEMELFFQQQILGGGVKYIPPAEVWTPIRFTFTTGKEVTHLGNWGICFVKTAWPWHAYGGTYGTTYVDNVRLRKDLTGETLLFGGDFEENYASSVYDLHWRPAVFHGGAALGVTIVEDPLDRTNHCLRFPETIHSTAYPLSLPLQAHCFGHFAALERDIRCIEFYGRPQHRFLLVERGRITVEMGEMVWTVPAGGMICLPPHTPYRYTYHCGENTSYYWLAVSGKHLPLVLETLQLTTPRPINLPRIEALNAFINAMLQADLKAKTYPYVVSGELQLFLGELEQQLAPKFAETKHQKLLRRIAKRLHDHPETTPENKALAAERGLSETYFIRLFKQEIGISPHQCRLRALVQKACERLIETQDSVQEIAYSLGFDDPLYFSRVFRSICGISPREYRKARKEPLT